MKVFRDSEIVKRKLSKIPDPVILDYENFRIELGKKYKLRRIVQYD
jgi:hypothetical protein